MMLNKEEVQAELIKETKIFHFGTLSMTHGGVREATKEAIRIAEESGAVISFDPNYAHHFGTLWMRQRNRYCMD